MINTDAIRRELSELDDRMRKLKAELINVEAARFVGVQFHGHAKTYTYELAPGHEAGIGDYVQVWSAWTGRNELVKVVRKGRGPWTGRTKVCHQIHIRVRRPSGTLLAEADPFGVDECPRF